MDELIKRLRASVDGRYEKCDVCPYEEDYPCCVDCLDKMHKQAADVIEGLQQQVEHYHGCMNDWFQEACDLKVMNEQQAKNFDILFNIVLKIVEQIAERLNIETSHEPPKEE